MHEVLPAGSINISKTSEMDRWGYKIREDRQAVWEEGDFAPWHQLVLKEPSVRLCISCGTCASGCTSALFTDFSLRRMILLVQRGRKEEVAKEINKCLLCGKCILNCPRGVNTRNVVIQIRQMLERDVLS